jgi:8-oxo-dGTP diphosphatase
MMQKVSQFRIALYGVFVADGKVLMTETQVPSGSIMNFPGGGLELGEAPLDAIHREFQEETGLEIKVQKLLFCSERFQQNPEYPHEQLMHIYFEVISSSRVSTLSGNGDDVVSLRWVPFAELSSLRILPVDQEFINHPSFTSLF